MGQLAESIGNALAALGGIKPVKPSVQSGPPDTQAAGPKNTLTKSIADSLGNALSDVQASFNKIPYNQPSGQQPITFKNAATSTLESAKRWTDALPGNQPATIESGVSDEEEGEAGPSLSEKAGSILSGIQKLANKAPGNEPWSPPRTEAESGLGEDLLELSIPDIPEETEASRLAYQDYLEHYNNPVQGTKHEYAQTAEEERADYLKNVDGGGDQFAWKMPDGSVVGYDINGDGRLTLDEIDEGLLGDYYDKSQYLEDEKSIGEKGYSILGPNTWDQAAEQGLITSEEAEAGKNSGQTYLDTRFGDLYKVKRKAGNESDKYAQLYDDDYTDVIMKDGALVDRTSAVADMNAQRRLQNDIREMSAHYNTDEADEWDYGTYEPGIVNLLNKFFLRGDEVRTSETDPYVLDVVSQEVLPGESYATDGGVALYDRFVREGEDGKVYADPNNWFFGDSTAAYGQGTLLSDAINAIGVALSGGEGALRDAPNSNEDWVINGEDKYSDTDVNREADKFRKLNYDDSDDNAKLAELLYGIYGTEEEAADKYNELYGTDYSKDMFYYMPRNLFTIFDNDGNAVYDMTKSTYDQDVLNHADWYDQSTGMYTFPNGVSVPYESLWSEDDGGIKAHTSMTYDPSVQDEALTYTPFSTYGLDGSVPADVLLGLMNGSVLEQVDKGLGGKYQDIVGEDGLDVGAMVTHPIQTAAYAADTFMDSLPYMLPRGIGAAFGLMDTATAARGLDPWSYNSETGGYTDPGLLTNADYRNTITDTALESAMEYMLGNLGLINTNKVWDKLKKPATWEEAARKASNPESWAKKFAGAVGRNTLEEGVEESLTSLAQRGAENLVGGTSNLNVAKNEDGTTKQNVWGGVAYDNETSSADRVGNLAKEMLDSFIGGSLVGLPMSIPRGVSAAKNKTSVSDRLKAAGYESPTLSDEQVDEIIRGLENIPYEEAI